ncbi:MAG: hypothetical protein WDZ31_10305 [Phycisphaeraceae bacterium]
MLKKAIALTSVMLLGAATVGCGTVEGVGRDTQWVGEGIQDVSQEFRP